MPIESVGFEEVCLPTYWVTKEKRKCMAAPTFIFPTARAEKRYPQKGFQKRNDFVAVELFDFCELHISLAEVIATLMCRNPNPAISNLSSMHLAAATDTIA